MLNPRLFASPPVFQVSSTRLAPFRSVPDRAANACSWMLVGAAIVSVWVDELLAVFGSVGAAVAVAVCDTTPDVPAPVTIVMVAVPAFAMVPKRHVTEPPASEQVPVVVVAER